MSRQFVKSLLRYLNNYVELSLSSLKPCLTSSLLVRLAFNKEPSTMKLSPQFVKSLLYKIDYSLWTSTITLTFPSQTVSHIFSLLLLCFGPFSFGVKSIRQNMVSLPSPSWSSTLRQFSLSDIRKATNNFDQSLIIRRGWSFEVFKGTYDDYDGTTKTVAIRRTSLEPSSQEAWSHSDWFKKELEAWSQYRHKHVVSVVGFCHEIPHIYIVVYEFMPNGSLAIHLGTKITPISFQLPWDQCLQICTDAARGLEYLHTSITYSKGGSFAHGDVTPSNIMLDGNGVAKISDLYYEPFREHEPAFLFDPECHSTSRAKQSSDVYAFGVLLVKVLSRKVSFDKEGRNLGIWFKKSIMNQTIHRIIQPDIKSQVSSVCLEAFIHIADECLNNESQKHPSVSQVVKKLELLMTPSSQRLCCRYSLQEIKDVTNNFKSIILGQGGEGTVYKGLTKTKTTVAVKRLKPERSLELEKEIKMLSNLDHPNLVSLVGYCQESDENILVYEFMCNGSLSKSLHGGSSSLSWKQRLDICVGAAHGLRYLRKGTSSSRKGIIHRDIKPVNILLDENFHARISDFGLSRMGAQDQSKSEITTLVKGTRGYYAPEYQKYGKITRRIDVYAFGVVLAELLCRKKPWDREESFYPTENEKYGQWAKGDIDPDLEGEIAPACLEAFTCILEKCLNKDPKRRPSMNDVVSILEYAVECQDVWLRHKSEGDFYLPCREDNIVLYYYSNLHQHIKLRALLRSYKMQVDERDLRKDLYANDFKNLIFKENVDARLPLVFLRGKYIGDNNEMEKLHKTGVLFDILEGPFPCKQTKRFVHCKNCDALTEIWENGELWGGQLRSCIECDGNDQSIHLVELAPLGECGCNEVLCILHCLVICLCETIFSLCQSQSD